MRYTRGASREVASFQVHLPVHVDDVQPEEAVADGLDASFIDPHACLRQKAVSGRQHPPEWRFNASPDVWDCESLLHSCVFNDLHPDDRI